MKVAIHNLGCKVNSYELDNIRESLVERGYEIVPFDTQADIYIVNTCTVTNIADRKSRQMLHRAAKNNPAALVVALGCYVNSSEGQSPNNDYIIDRKDSPAPGVDPVVDIAIGNDKKSLLPEILEEHLLKRGVAPPDISDGLAGEEEELRYFHEASGRTRAFIKIQDGCDRFCSYCIIPYVRGRLKSRSSDDIYDEAKKLSKEGYREIVLTGIHISSYGKDEGRGSEALVELLLKLNEIEGIQRIRLGSLEPVIITEEFCKKISTVSKLCPHFHLSLQSGSGTVLKRMNRRYTPERYREGVMLLRKYFPDVAVTTDIIVGFPGETREEFLETVEFLRDVKLYQVHIFRYSRRKGTVADTLPGQLTEKEKAKRADELGQVTEALEREYLKSFDGRILSVLFEEEEYEDGLRYMTGHSSEYIRVRIPSEEDLANVIREVEYRFP